MNFSKTKQIIDDSITKLFGQFDKIEIRCSDNCLLFMEQYSLSVFNAYF